MEARAGEGSSLTFVGILHAVCQDRGTSCWLGLIVLHGFSPMQVGGFHAETGFIWCEIDVLLLQLALTLHRCVYFAFEGRNLEHWNSLAP